MPEHPESFPVNALVPIEGTPLENNDVSVLIYLFLSDKIVYPSLARVLSHITPYDRNGSNCYAQYDNSACCGTSDT